ncbi:MAG: hypothetical protein V1794_01880, partial [Candidatus Glassbacteria bacterium]
ILPPDINNFTFETFNIVRSDTPFVVTLTDGPYMGMVSLNQPIDITSGVSGPKSSRYQIRVSVQGLQIPIFQFGVFYDDSLEIHNGALMDFVGRVHTNSSLFVGTNATTNFYRNITIAGDLYRFRIWNHEIFTGSVRISDPDSVFHLLTYDSGTYAGNDAGFVAQTNADFRGRLRTRAHNITPLGLPIPKSIQPIEIIKRRNAGDGVALTTERLDWQADTRVYVNSALSSVSIMNNSGNPKVLSNPTALATSYDAFYDDREHQWVDLMVLDVSKLTAGDLANGIVYISIAEDGTRQKGIKIINGGTLPAPMTVVSDNAIYIQGTYNTTNWRPSAVMADAVYLLSTNWTDAANHNTNSSLNAAATTTYRVAILSGDTQNITAYNGGLENFPRFLENWSGRTCTIVGSFINLFPSQNSTGLWVYGSPIYEAPARDWWFDLNFLNFDNLPPGTPSVGSVLRIAFRQEFFE